MQIYEVMRPKKPALKEINLAGAVKSIGSAAKAAVKALPQAASAAAGQYLEKQSGIQGLAALTQPQANPYAGAGARDKAMAAVATVSKPQAKQQKALFDKALSQLMAEKGVTDAAQLSLADTKGLMQNLNQQVLVNLLQGRLDNYQELVDKENDPPEVQQKAQDIVSRIDTAISSLQNVSKYSKTDANTQLKTWEELTKAAGEAAVLMQFDKNRIVGGRKTAASPPAANSAVANAAVQKMAQNAAAGRLTARDMRMNQSDIRNFQSRFPPGTNPKLDALFQAIGLYSTP